jgi:hypothetical protein
LLNAARIRQDERLLLKIENADLHAKDVLYHPSCYRDYTSPRQLDLLAKKELFREEDSSEGSPQQRAFERLVKDVDEKLLGDTTSVMSLSELCTLYKAYLQKEGLVAENYRSHSLKAWLLRQFGSRLSFHRPERRNMAQYVSSSVAPPGPLIELCSRKNRKEQDWEEDEYATSFTQDRFVIDTAGETANVYVAAMMHKKKISHLLEMC